MFVAPFCSNTEEVVDQPKLLCPPNNARLRDYQIVGLQATGGLCVVI
jgi:hypothetical protein